MKSVVRALVKGRGSGSCLIRVVGSAYHGSTSANLKVERASGVVSDTLRAYRDASGRKDDSDGHRPLTVFIGTINSAASTPGGDQAPFFVGRGTHPRRLLSPPPFDDLAAGEPPAHCHAQRMRAMGATERELLAAAQAERRAKLEVGRPP